MFQNPTANIIFIEKRRSFPASYEQGRRAALARSLGRTRNVFLTKMDALLPETKCKRSLPKSNSEAHMDKSTCFHMRLTPQGRFRRPD